MIAALVAALLVMPHPVATIQTGDAPCGAATGFGAVWVANDGSGTLARIDPRRNRATRRVTVGEGACSVATGAGAVWVVNYKSSALIRIDQRTLRARSVRVGAVPFDVLVAFGRVWVTAWEDGVLDELDPGTLEVVRRIEVGARPMGLAARHGAVWVGFGRDATAIARVDPGTATITRFPVGSARRAGSSRGRPICGSRRRTPTSSTSTPWTAGCSRAYTSAARSPRAPLPLTG